MELLKRYVAASSMGAVALVCILIGLLGVTVLRPPSQQVSTVESATDLIMTRDNVLSIVKDDVTVTATSKSGAPVTLVIGTSQDAKGWIGNAAFTEVIGVEADRTKLKAESHAANGTGMVNPNAQNAVQSGAQPLDDPTSAQLTDQLAKSPMWFKQESGTGSVSLDLENVPSGRSAVAASAGGPGDLTFTLTWQVEQVNMLAIIAFLTAAFFALLAFALFLTRWQLLRLRKIRAQRIEERRKADTLDTSTINAAEVAEMVAAARESGSRAAHAPAVSEPPVVPPPAAEPAVDETAADEPVVADDDEAVVYMFEDAQSEEIEDSTQKQAAPAWGAAAFVSSTGQAPASDRTRDELSARDAAVREPLPLRSTRDKSIVRASIVGVPAPVQHAMAIALANTEHVQAQRAVYAVRRALLLEALTEAGLDVDPDSAAGLYLWVADPAHPTDSWALVNRLAELGILVAPGDFYGTAAHGRVRVALTASDERIAAAAQRIRQASSCRRVP